MDEGPNQCTDLQMKKKGNLGDTRLKSGRGQDNFKVANMGD